MHFKWKLITIVSLGGLLETYDFLIYALMTPYISQLFFPAEQLQDSLLLTFATFSVGYLSRPLGGLLFGHQGDRQGRKKPFTYTILIMAGSTFLMGCLPVYSQIGLWAPALLILLRLLQGISMGGETGGAFTYLSETAQKRKATAVAIAMCGMSMGFVLGHLVHALLLHLYGKEGMINQGWRIPFFLGGILGIVGYIIRKKFHETLAFKQLQQQQQVSRTPAKELFTRYPLNACCGLLFITIHSVTLVLLIIFMPSYLMTLNPDVNLATTGGVSMLVAALIVIPFGCCLDYFGGNKVLKLAVACELIFGLPLVWLIFAHPDSTKLAILASSLLVGLNAATLITLTTTLFPTAIRYSGIAISYNLGFAIGGMTPVLATLLPSALNQPWAAGYLLLGCGLLGIVAASLYHRLDIPFPFEGYKAGQARMKSTDFTAG